MREPQFDLEKVYDEQIAPLMKQIIAICKKHKLPMLAEFCFKSDGEGGHDFCATCIPRGKKEWLPQRMNDARDALVAKPFIMAFAITKAPESN